MTLEQKIGQFFFPAVFINDSEENIQKTEDLIREYNIGGLTFFHSRASAATNYESKKQVISNDNSYERLIELIVRYQKCAATPLLMSIDAEWGLAMRIEKTPQYPYAITLGALPMDKKNLIYEVGKQIGLDLKSAGIHYNLAPLADINNNPKNPVIGYRSFGENKEKVAERRKIARNKCKELLNMLGIEDTNEPVSEIVEEIKEAIQEQIAKMSKENEFEENEEEIVTRMANADKNTADKNDERLIAVSVGSGGSGTCSDKIICVEANPYVTFYRTTESDHYAEVRARLSSNLNLTIIHNGDEGKLGWGPAPNSGNTVTIRQSK